MARKLPEETWKEREKVASANPGLTHQELYEKHEELFVSWRGVERTRRRMGESGPQASNSGRLRRRGPYNSNR